MLCVTASLGHRDEVIPRRPDSHRVEALVSELNSVSQAAPMASVRKREGWAAPSEKLGDTTRCAHDCSTVNHPRGNDDPTPPGWTIKHLR